MTTAWSQPRPSPPPSREVMASELRSLLGRDEFLDPVARAFLWQVVERFDGDQVGRTFVVDTIRDAILDHCAPADAVFADGIAEQIVGALDAQQLVLVPHGGA